MIVRRAHGVAVGAAVGATAAPLQRVLPTARPPDAPDPPGAPRATPHAVNTLGPVDFPVPCLACPGSAKCSAALCVGQGATPGPARAGDQPDHPRTAVPRPGPWLGSIRVSIDVLTNFVSGFDRIHPQISTYISTVTLLLNSEVHRPRRLRDEKYDCKFVTSYQASLQVIHNP